jgi:hypothetical protein
MKITVFWDVALCSLVQLYQRFRSLLSPSSTRLHGAASPEDSHLQSSGLLLLGCTSCMVMAICITQWTIQCQWPVSLQMDSYLLIIWLRLLLREYQIDRVLKQQQLCISCAEGGNILERHTRLQPSWGSWEINRGQGLTTSEKPTHQGHIPGRQQLAYHYRELAVPAKLWRKVTASQG